ncbi:MAG: septum formation inhibitor Maf [Flavobacteriales bacterium]|nr:septum formation inhibitor Maf [Flavobacteriales bacterium]
MTHTWIILCFILVSCFGSPVSTFIKDASSHKELSAEQKAYWYAGEAELTSYQLKQARYGEIHEGQAVLIFVTEPFSTKNWTKADEPTSSDVPVLKLNFTKKFNTGIYPYSMMTSTFLPVDGAVKSLKISSSSQEWCGHTYMEMRNKLSYEFKTDSYFESESGTFNLKKDYLEDDLWSIIRLHPDLLPEGEIAVIPSFFYLRLRHKEAKAYTCQIAKEKVNATTTSYTLTYPELERTLRINYQTQFPYQIISWEETYLSGWGESKEKLTTTAEKIKTLNSAYWTKNSNKDSGLRTELGLNQ